MKGKGKILKAGEVQVTDVDGKDAGVIKVRAHVPACIRLLSVGLLAPALLPCTPPLLPCLRRDTHDAPI